MEQDNFLGKSVIKFRKNI